MFSKIKSIFSLNLICALVCFFAVLSVMTFVFKTDDISYVTADTEVVNISTYAELSTFTVRVNDGEDLSGVIVNLSNDIDCKGESLVPIGNLSHPFEGTFNGNGYVIKNFKFDYSEDSNYYGLFGVCENSTISCLGIENFNLNEPENEENFFIGNNYFGTLIAFAKNTVVENCYVQNFSTTEDPNKVIINSYGTLFIGGLIGFADNSSEIRNCYADFKLKINHFAEVSTINNYIGGIVGYLSTSRIFNTGFTGEMEIVLDNEINLNTKLNFGGIAGYIADSTIRVQNCYMAGSLKVTGEVDEMFVGTIIGTLNTAQLPNSNFISYCYYLSDENINNGFLAIGKKGEFVPVPTLSIVSELQLKTVDFYINSDNWNELGEHQFDFEYIWFIHDDYPYPMLQVFQIFEFLAQSSDSSVSFKFYEFDGDKFVLKGEESLFKCGERVMIKVVFDEEEENEVLNNYYRVNSWLKDGLYFNGGNLSDDNKTIEFESYYNQSGTYSVEIKPKDITTNLKVGLYSSTPVSNFGKVKINNSTALETITREIAYNSQFTIEAVAGTNFAFVGWYKVDDFDELEMEDLNDDDLVFEGRYKNLTLNDVLLKGETTINLLAVFTDQVYSLTINFNAEYGKVGLLGEDLTEVFENQNTPKAINPTLVAEAEEGYYFDGWYTDSNFTIKLSSETTFVYEPNNLSNQIIYARFLMISEDLDGLSTSTLIWIIIGSVLGGGLIIAGIVLFIIFGRRKGSYKRNFKF